MGHTLVARFEPKDFDSVNRCLMGWQGKTINKIPFGRNCDREEANRILPFHMTLLHWARSADSYMLQKMNALSFSLLPKLKEISEYCRLPAKEFKTHSRDLTRNSGQRQLTSMSLSQDMLNQSWCSRINK